MRNIFALTKREQRIVILVLMALLAAALAKHHLDSRSPPPTKSTSTLPTATPSHLPGEEDQTAADDSP